MSPIKFRWQWTINAKKDQVWQAVADPVRVQNSLGISNSSSNDTKTNGGQIATKNQAKYLLLICPDPILSFDWINNQEYRVTIQSKGMVEKICMQVILEESGGQTQINYIIDLFPASIFGKITAPFIMSGEIKTKLSSYYKEVEHFINHGFQPQDSTTVGDRGAAGLLNTPEAKEILSSIESKLITEGFKDTWARSLIQYISYEPESSLLNMNPFQLGILWGMPRKRSLELFLSSTYHGLLCKVWEIRCPKCLKIQMLSSHLKDIHKKGSCQGCQIVFTNNLSQNVELNFYPNPKIRPMQKKITDIKNSNPNLEGKILIHQKLNPGEVKAFKTTLPEGKYRVRTPATTQSQWKQLRLPNGNNGEISVEIGGDDIYASFDPNQGKMHNFHIANRTNEPQTLIIEDLSWKNDLISATMMNTTQRFRELFPQENLPIEDPIPAGSIAILFVDITESTALFIKKGDDSSYYFIREYFTFLRNIIDQYEGSIIKAMGDNVMIAFNNPIKGVEAMLMIQKEFETFNATLPENEQLAIRLGMHYGECLAVNLNHILDYFGHTINIAAFMQKKCKKGQVVVSDDVWNIPQAEKMLKSCSKGFEAVEGEVYGQERTYYLISTETENEEKKG
jgi:class 3 adenylate cyclase/carbon monoxide dehydrogenase subunit G